MWALQLITLIYADKEEKLTFMQTRKKCDKMMNLFRNVIMKALMQNMAAITSQYLMYKSKRKFKQERIKCHRGDLRASKKGGSNCLISNISCQNLAASRRQWPKLGWELTSVWPKLTSTRSQILVTDVYSQPNSGHWHYLTTKFWPLTLEIRQLLPPLSASKH